MNKCSYFSKMTPLVDQDHNIFMSRLVFYPLLFVATFMWLFHRWQQQTRFYKMGNMIPGPDTVPFFGNALMAFFKKPDRKLYSLFVYFFKVNGVLFFCVICSIKYIWQDMSNIVIIFKRATRFT